MKRRHLLIPPWVLAACGAAACTADAPLAPRATQTVAARIESWAAPPGAVSVWTLILTDTAGHVWVVQTDAGEPDTLRAGEWSGSAALWSRLDSAPSARDLTLRTTLLRRVDPLSRSGLFGLLVRWQLDGSGVAWTSVGSERLAVDRRQRTWRSTGWAEETGGGAGTVLGPVRFDLIADTPMPAAPITDPMPRGGVIVRTPAVVSLRIDDCMGGDVVAFEILQELGLTAEMAVPSRRVDRPGHCSQQLLEAMVAAGDAVESHSRLHGPTPASFADFYLEASGSALDLRRRGFEPLVFIPPGTWRRGPTLMSSAGKLVGPYAELLRREYVSTESYALPTGVPIPAPGRDGVSSLPLRAFTPLALEWRLRNAATDSQWIGFMWHSWDMSSAELEARLRIIAALRDSGLVTVLPYYAALHAARQ